MFTEDEIKDMLGETYTDMSQEIDFESFLKVSPLEPRECSCIAYF